MVYQILSAITIVTLLIVLWFVGIGYNNLEDDLRLVRLDRMQIVQTYTDKVSVLKGDILQLIGEKDRMTERMADLAALQPVLPFLEPADIDAILSVLTPSLPFDSDIRITSRFGESRGFQGILRDGHKGNDIVPLGGWQVHPMWEGEVVDIRIDSYLGKLITIQHSDRVRTRYAHLATIYYTALPGEQVNSDTVIGYMGSTGHSDGSHLHLELQVFDGTSWRVVDIYRFLKGHGDK